MKAKAARLDKDARRMLYERAVNMKFPNRTATADDIYKFLDAQFAGKMKPSFDLLIHMNRKVQAEKTDAKMAYATHQGYVASMRPINTTAVHELIKTCYLLRDYETLMHALKIGGYNQLFFTADLEPLQELVDALAGEREYELLEQVHKHVFPELIFKPRDRSAFHNEVVQVFVDAEEFARAQRVLQRLLNHKWKVSGRLIDYAITTVRRLEEEGEGGSAATDAPQDEKDLSDGNASGEADAVTGMELPTALARLTFADCRSDAVEALGDRLHELPQDLQDALLNKDGTAPTRKRIPVPQPPRKSYGPNGLERLLGGNPAGEPCRRLELRQCGILQKCCYSHE
ncbi:hypothetical protein AB1Y20_021949 [Prymnesium parvum]